MTFPLFSVAIVFGSNSTKRRFIAEYIQCAGHYKKFAYAEYYVHVSPVQATCVRNVLRFELFFPQVSVISFKCISDTII